MSLTPMMKHYVELKEKYKDAVLFYRLGDFYEMFYEDAELCSKLLELTLTGKDCGLNDRAPMCGFPFHAVDTYVQKLIELGYKVAICEQLSVPEKGLKLVDRDVIRIITPGTLIGTEILDNNVNNYLCAVYKEKDNIGIALCDISTGEFGISEFNNENVISRLDDFLIMKKPSEIICNEDMLLYSSNLLSVKGQQVPNFSIYNSLAFNYKDCENLILKQFNVKSLKEFNCANKVFAIRAGGALLQYLMETQKRQITQINELTYNIYDKYMQIDGNTRRNLELLETSKDRKKKGSLIWLLDKTNTVMGSRLLRQYISQPLINEKEINLRLDAVEMLVKNIIQREELKNYLNKVYDLERLCSKVAFGNITPKDCLSLANSLELLPNIKTLICKINNELLNNINNEIYDFSILTKTLKDAINEDSDLAKENGFIKKNFNKEYDELLDISVNSKKWIANLETRERDRTGIKNLKIKYNKIFGYYIEILNSQKEYVPTNYIRRQTVANAERYTIDELKEIEYKLFNCNEQKDVLETKIFNELKQQILVDLFKIQKSAKSIAVIDCLLSFATVAVENNYVKPVVTKNNKTIEIIDGRHPIIEKLNKESFVPNNVFLDNAESRTMLITGPNMAGKSTYMRQVAIITLMAHIGCFVPCKSATISLTDRIFTRVGASDDLSFGQSTFMVEMMEVSNILKNATNNSLIILDEIGRGTSTYDGLSIAWSVMEYISKYLNAKTLFSTHYHELTSLEGILDGVKNYKVAVKDFNNSIIFLRKIQRGGTSRSFGIEVASLAGLPEIVLKRAKDILKTLENNEISLDAILINDETKIKSETKNKNIQNILSVINDLNINTLSPLSAFDILVQLKEYVEKN